MKVFSSENAKREPEDSRLRWPLLNSARSYWREYRHRAVGTFSGGVLHLQRYQLVRQRSAGGLLQVNPVAGHCGCWMPAFEPIPHRGASSWSPSEIWHACPDRPQPKRPACLGTLPHSSSSPPSKQSRPSCRSAYQVRVTSTVEMRTIFELANSVAHEYDIQGLHSKVRTRFHRGDCTVGTALDSPGTYRWARDVMTRGRAASCLVCRLRNIRRSHSFFPIFLVPFLPVEPSPSIGIRARLSLGSLSDLRLR